METSKRNETNPVVFFDIRIDGETVGKLVFELFKDVVPKTAENFRQLCTGEAGIGQATGLPLHYKGCPFHRMIKGFMAQGGDFSNKNGTGGESIYGEKFEDENFDLKHDDRGLLSMANAGANTNGSQFFITFVQTKHLNGKHVVFGKLLVGRGVLREMERLPTGDNDKPAVECIIEDCGELDPGVDGNQFIQYPEGCQYAEFPEEWQWPEGKSELEEKLNAAESIKQLGNQYFKGGKCDMAMKRYRQGLRYLDLDIYKTGEPITPETTAHVKELSIALLVNRAACYLKLGRPRAAVADCSRVLEKDADHVKALFRRSQGYTALKRLGEATEDLSKAAKLMPQDKGIRGEYAKLKKLVEERRQKERKAFSKMFG